jgi:hypothetical protein
MFTTQSGSAHVQMTAYAMCVWMMGLCAANIAAPVLGGWVWVLGVGVL